MTAKQFKYRQWIAVLLIAVVVAGCSLFGPRIRIDGVTLDVALRANDDSPIAVDFVAVNDAGLLRQLSAMTADEWFAQRAQFQRDYPQQLYTWGMELVPGQLVESGVFPLQGKPALGLLAFAHYGTPGAHRLRLDDQRWIWLKFDSREMTLHDEKAIE